MAYVSLGEIPFGCSLMILMDLHPSVDKLITKYNQKNGWGYSIWSFRITLSDRQDSPADSPWLSSPNGPGLWQDEDDDSHVIASLTAGPGEG